MVSDVGDRGAAYRDQYLASEGLKVNISVAKGRNDLSGPSSPRRGCGSLGPTHSKHLTAFEPRSPEEG